MDCSYASGNLYFFFVVFLFFLSLLYSWANFIGELYVCILAETLYQETRVCIRGDGWDQQQLLLSTAHGQHAFFFIFFLIIIFWFFDFFGNWPNTLRCRQRVAWEWARATKKVRGYATFCNLNHTCPLTKVFGNSHLLILKFAVLSFLQSILVE